MAAELENGRFSVGTGVPVARGLLLTARHVVVPDGVRPDRPVRVRFWYAQDELPETVPLRAGNGFEDACAAPDGDAEAARGVIWSAPELDLALVQVAHPPSIAWATLSPEAPANQRTWLSEGFPHATWEHGAPRPIRLSGDTHSREGDSAFFQVDARVGMVEADTVDGWSGASGAGIYVDNYLVGILLERRPNAEARILRAVAIADCRRNREFCHLLGLPHGDQPGNPHVDDLVVALAAVQPLSKTELARSLGISENSDNEALARALMARPVREGLSLLVALQYGPWAVEPATMKRIGLSYSAAQYRPPNAAELGQFVFSETCDFVHCVTGNPTGAEFLMAAVENRAPRLCTPSLEATEYPYGTHALPELPETGSDPAAVAQSRDLEARIGYDLLEVDAFIEGNVGRLHNSPMDTVRQQQRRRELLIDELEERAALNPEEPTYYFAQPDPGPDRQAERLALQHRLRAIRQEYGKIGAVIINLDKTREENRRFRRLLPLLTKE
nr:serine protease [Ruegeria sp. HKCCA6837]